MSRPPSPEAALSRGEDVRITARGTLLAAREAIHHVGVALLITFVAFLAMQAFMLDPLRFGFDFRGTLWDAGLAIRDGVSPYPPPLVTALEVGNPALYPPLAILGTLPLTVLPWEAAVTVWTILLVAGVSGGLWLLGVRDPRCHLLTVLSPVVVIGLVFGNLTLLLIPALALAWLWRGRAVRVGVVVGLAIAVKLFLWPLLVWLAATRRWHSVAVAIGVTVTGILGSWALIGFDGLWSYPDLLRVAEKFYGGRSFSLATIGSGLGLDVGVGSKLALAVALAIAAVALAVGRRPDGDAASLSLVILAAILGSPIVWPYYYALLYVPLAIARPRFSWLWAVGILFYVADSFPRVFVSPVPCCRPDETPATVWIFNHSPPGLWPALAHVVLAGAMSMVFVTILRRDRTA